MLRADAGSVLGDTVGRVTSLGEICGRLCRMFHRWARVVASSTCPRCPRPDAPAPGRRGLKVEPALLHRDEHGSATNYTVVLVLSVILST